MDERFELAVDETSALIIKTAGPVVDATRPAKICP